MNGVPMEKKYLDGENFEEGIMMSIMKVTNDLQRAVYHNKLKDSDDVLDYLMKQPNIMPRLNDRILAEDKDKVAVVDLASGHALPKLTADSFRALDAASMAATVAEHMDYLTLRDDAAKRLNVLTAWVVADFETEQGREILRGAVSHVKSSSLMRVGVIQNVGEKEKVGLISKIVKAAFSVLDNAGAKNLLSKVLKEDTVKKLLNGKKKLADYDIPGADMSALVKAVEEIADKDFEI